MNGRERVARAFAARRGAALMPYYTLGYPDRETALAVVEAIAPASDLIELGVPFSDPLADGPTIQRSTQQALAAGATTARCLEDVATLRSRGVTTPFLLMGYYNPILAYGEAAYAREAAAAGADGFIVPDLPPEEAGPLQRAAGAAGLALIPFLAPTSSAQRIGMIAAGAHSFIYLVSLAGVTGARSQLARDLPGFIDRVRRETDTPLAVGFGISTPQQAAQVAAHADGIIVGSALINAVDAAGDKPGAAARFVSALQHALAAAP